jgi:hypothetical protein
MKFAGENGSWPAFWTFGNSDPETQDYINNKSEIDIAEHNWRKNWLGFSSCSTDHVLHWWWDPNIHGTEEMSIPEDLGTDKNNLSWSTWHIFKLIYTPYYVKFFIDGNSSFERSRYYYWNEGNDIDIEELSNYGYYGEYAWFPKHSMYLILSQQVCDADDINGEAVSPQTSSFDWVTIRYFFLSPEITVSDFICSNSGTASLEVDTLATNITWSLQPSNFFQTSSGSGKNANITVVSTAHGQATITYTFYMPSGEQYIKSKNFYVGRPNYYIRVTFPGCSPVPTNNYGEPTACPNTDYVFSIQNDFNLCTASEHVWQVPEAWSVNENNGYEISINTEDEPYNTMYVDAKDCCYDDISLSLTLESSQNCGYYRLIFAPNPSTTETTMTIEMVNNAQKFNESLNWEMEVYDQTQALKLRKTKIKGKDQKINTSGWKDGIYLVHVNYDGNDIIGKLSVKK